MTRSDVAAYLGVGDNMVNQLCRERKLPPPMKFGRRLRWDRRALDLALDRLSGISTASNAVEERGSSDAAMLRAIDAAY